jgi:hypothetical protein
VTKFWEASASALSARLFAAGGSALVFWVWAFSVWCIRQGGWPYLQGTVQTLFVQKDLALVLALVVGGVVVVWTSSLIVERLTIPVLRLLEGYWPGIADPLRNLLVNHWQKKVDALSDPQPRSASSQLRLTTAQVRMWRFPASGDVMPTRIGNIIRGGERRPAYWYGLDAVIVWPQLWLILPGQARNDLTHVRQQLDRSVAAFTWTVIACGLGLVWLPAGLAGVAAAWVIWRWWVPNAAQDYATLVSAVFDTQRFALYDSLHYARPTSPADEKAHGEALTRSLWSDPASAPRANSADKKAADYSG